MSDASARPSGLALMKAWYDRARLWIVYGSVLLVIAILYLGSFLGPVRDFMLPAALGVLTAFAVQSLQTIERQTGPHTSETEFALEVAAVPALQKIVASDREFTDVKIIAATGWTAVREVLPPLCQSSTAPTFRISMLLVDAAGPLAEVYPTHWAAEVQRVLEIVRRDLVDPRLQVSVSQYRYPPPLHGLLLNDEHLLVGFFGWRSGVGAPELAGAERPHRLYRRGDPASAQLFEIFDEWFVHVPRTEVVHVTAGHPA
ncbi:MAG: hypothetical protein ACTHN8_12410 [Angustibacter sp.]